ncbi:MAG TPA: hypothetical protein VFA20_18055 [Myxococcaceae bacterium]|nr:hypothetical protein [Myxococcaceae bacterium]
MSYLPAGASFEELVQDYFVAFRGSGLMLSPLDGELASQWAQSGVPFEVVARGIRRAAESALRDARPGESSLRTLRACKRAVEAEIKKFLDRSAGAASEAAAQEKLQEDREKKRRKALRKYGREHPEWAALLERAGARAQRQPPEVREEAVLVHALRLLPYAERIGLYREARRLCAAQEALSARARRLSRRFHVSAVVRRAMCLPSFW